MSSKMTREWVEKLASGKWHSDYQHEWQFDATTDSSYKYWCKNCLLSSLFPIRDAFCANKVYDFEKAAVEALQAAWTERDALREAAEECQDFLKEQGYPHGHLGLDEVMSEQKKEKVPLPSWFDRAVSHLGEDEVRRRLDEAMQMLKEKTCSVCGGTGYEEHFAGSGKIGYNRVPCAACSLRDSLNE